MTEHYELARRYSRALFESFQTSNERERVLEELRALQKSMEGAPEIRAYLNSPVVRQNEKVAVIEKLGATKAVSGETVGFIKFLIKKSRIAIFEQIVRAYQDANDEANGVVRGLVRSVHSLGKEERDQLSARISSVTGKRAVLEYKEDPTLIGGLVAQVGSYKFDDSLDTQLQLLSEELKRRAN